MKITLAIINRRKQRKHMQELIIELENDIKEAIRIKKRYETTLKILDFELECWDKQILNKK